MARKRMIDPDFWTDEKLGDCTRDERLLFMGLISNADDEGRGRANPKLVKSTVFAYDEDLSSDSINSMLANLDSKDLIQIYIVDKQEFYFVKNFKKHQVINKKQASKLPPPPENTPLHENYGNTTVVVQEYSVPREEKRREEKRKEEKGIEEKEKEDSLSHDKAIELLKFYEGRTCSSISSHYQLVVSLAEKYSVDDIKEAIVKALDKGKKDKAALDYAQGILKNWQVEGKPSVQISKPNFRNAKVSNFNNFEQRNYNFDELEGQLLEKSMGKVTEEDPEEMLRKLRTGERT